MADEHDHRYHNLDLVFDREDDRFLVRVLSSPAGQASEPFELPFSADQVENFTLKVAGGQRGLRSFGPGSDRLARDFGGRLHEAVFTGEVATCLRRSLDAASRDDVGLRIRLRLSDAPELTNIPWEYLYNQSSGKFLGVSARTPLVRYADLDEPTDVLTVHPPLRILVMTSAPRGTESLDVERELALLQRATRKLVAAGQVELRRLGSGTLRSLQGELRRGHYHALHYIGHGVFDDVNDQGLLALEDANGQLDAVSGQKLGQVLTDHRSLRMVVLNACEGGRASIDRPLGGVAQALVRQGVQAVVAMQFVISDGAAVTFSSELYAAIGDGLPIDAAVSEARKAVYIESNGVEWGTPALHLRADDGRIFTMEGEATARPLGAALPMVVPAGEHDPPGNDDEPERRDSPARHDRPVEDDGPIANRPVRDDEPGEHQPVAVPPTALPSDPPQRQPRPLTRFEQRSPSAGGWKLLVAVLVIALAGSLIALNAETIAAWLGGGTASETEPTPRETGGSPTASDDVEASDPEVPTDGQVEEPAPVPISAAAPTEGQSDPYSVDWEGESFDFAVAFGTLALSGGRVGLVIDRYTATIDGTTFEVGDFDREPRLAFFPPGAVENQNPTRRTMVLSPDVQVLRLGNVDEGCGGSNPEPEWSSASRDLLADPPGGWFVSIVYDEDGSITRVRFTRGC